ncbi:MAG: YesL family protein [Lachnospiraceae bacterium]|nr:YesL family protein [Lachnospiraceae bacterium]
MAQYKESTPFGIIMRVLGDLITLNILWLVCAAPIVTFGASTTAMVSTMFKRRRYHGVPVVKTFIKEFGKNFRKATLINLVFLPLMAIAIVDYWFSFQKASGAVYYLYMGIASVALIAALMILTFAFSQLSVFDNKVKNYLKNSFILAMIAPGRMLLCWLFFFIPWGILFYVWYPYDFLAYFGAFYLIWGISGPAYLSVMQLEKVYSRFGYDKKPKEPEEE